MFDKLKYKIWRHLNKKYNKPNAKDTFKSFDKKYILPKNTYQNLIAVTGFGYSGSGALLDLLSEFKNLTVLSDADPDGSLREKNYDGGTNELNLLRHAGGLFFLEKFFPSKNIFIQDVVVKMFISLVKEHYLNNGPIFNNEFLRLTNEFLNNIIDIKLKTDYGEAYEPHLPFLGKESFDFIEQNPNNTQYLYTLKELSKDEYIKFAKNYLNKFLNTINSKKYLALDQALSDNECDIEHYKKYIDNLKVIAVYRDPRDVFATTIQRNVQWIPHDIDQFIKWYRRSVAPYIENKNNDYMVLRFEDLVYKKDEIVKKIEKFLNLEDDSHINPKSAFDENVSISNVGLYHSLGMKNEIKKIEEELGEFLYKKEFDKNNSPLVSICCLSYNHAKFIKEAIESFWNQEYKNIEIIALDDGSKDNSVEVLNELAKISPCPMKVISQDNTGNIPKNFNRLIKNAQGKYVSMIALDDMLSPISISNKLRLMEKDENIAFVIDSRLKSIDSDSNITGDVILTTDGFNTLNYRELIDREYHQKWTFYTQGSLFRMDVLKDIGGYDEDMISDDDVLRLKHFNYLKENPEKYCWILSNPTCYYRMHSSNVSRNLFNNCLMISEVYDKFFPNLKKSFEYKQRVKNIIRLINYKQFKKLKYFKNENKSAFEEWIFFHYYKIFKKKSKEQKSYISLKSKRR